MNIKMMEEDSLLELKSNILQLAPKFSMRDNSWIEEYFGRSPYINTIFTIEDFNLDTSQEKSYLTDFENVKRVYNHLKFLSDSQASDERLWAGLCLTSFWNYTQYRWNITRDSLPQSIYEHFFFVKDIRRALVLNAASRLWWIGRLTYDETRSNPYELTSFICENQRYIVDILERYTSNNPMILRPFISALIDARNQGIIINTDRVRDLSKYLNLLGGTLILDCLPSKVIYGKILNKAHELGKWQFKQGEFHDPEN